MSSLTKNIIQIAAVFFLAALVVNADWSAPTAAPPGNNTAVPVNVSSTTQNKAGTLGVGALSVFGDAYLGGTTKVGGNNIVEFGYNVSGKEISAGKIGYQVFTSDALDIVGAGSSVGSRKVKIWDTLDVNGSICFNGDCKSSWSQTGGTGGGGLISRTCTNAQSLSGGSQAIAECVTAANTGDTWRAVNCKRAGAAAEVAGGDFLKYLSGKWFIQFYTGSWINTDCIDGSVVIVKVNARSGGSVVFWPARGDTSSPSNYTYASSVPGYGGNTYTSTSSSCDTICPSLGYACMVTESDPYWGAYELPCWFVNSGTRVRCKCF